MKQMLYTLLILSLATGGMNATDIKSDTVYINVDVNDSSTSIRPLWAWIGYDEPNYTYMKDGKKLLTELSAMSLTTTIHQ